MSNGVLIINKPSGLTSHDVVNLVRRLLQQRSVGHLGTLDPLATGVLPLVVGSMTRLAQFYTSAEKTYEGTIRFGFATDTYDADGEPLAEPKAVVLSMPGLRELARGFQGLIEQMPPPFYAKKIKGVPAYKLARKKLETHLSSVKVKVEEFEILNLEGNRAFFRARVASGTYMRSIAHDMGQRMGCGAHLESLCRTSAGNFKLAEAHTLEELQAAAPDRLGEMFVRPRMLLPGIPSITANDEMAEKIRSGLSVNLPEFSQAPRVKVFYGQSELIAIATRIAGTLFHAKIVLTGNAVGQTSSK
jgi:tRNA pseudouridine55 synthase